MITQGTTVVRVGQYVETAYQITEHVSFDMTNKYITFNNQQTKQDYFRLRMHNGVLQYQVNLGGNTWGGFQDLIPLQAGVAVQDRIQDSLISQRILADVNDIKINSNGQLIGIIDNPSGQTMRQQSSKFMFQVNGDNTQSNDFEIKGMRDPNGSINQTVLQVKQRDFTSLGQSSMAIIQVGIENDVGGSIDFGTGKFIGNPVDLQSASFIQCLNPETQILAISSGQALVNNTTILYSDNNTATHPLQTQFNRKTGYDPNNLPSITEDTQFVYKQYLESHFYENTMPLNSITLATADVSVNNHKITNLANPTLPQDAVPLSYLQSNYLPNSKIRSGTIDVGNIGNTGTVSLTVTGDLISAQKSDAFANRDSYIDIVFANNGSQPLGFVQYVDETQNSTSNELHIPVILTTTNTTMRIRLEKLIGGAIHGLLNIMLVSP